MEKPFSEFYVAEITVQVLCVDLAWALSPLALSTLLQQAGRSVLICLQNSATESAQNHTFKKAISEARRWKIIQV